MPLPHPDAPRYFAGDDGRIRPILTNIVGNAIKFTKRGQVVVRVSCNSQHDGCGDDVAWRERSPAVLARSGARCSSNFSAGSSGPR